MAGARQQRLVTMAAKQISVDIEKPIGLAFKESKAAGGGLVVTVGAIFAKRMAADANTHCPSTITHLRQRILVKQDRIRHLGSLRSVRIIAGHLTLRSLVSP